MLALSSAVGEGQTRSACAQMKQPLVYALDRWHPTGIVCGNPCEYCGHGDAMKMSAPGSPAGMVPIPMFLVREATYDEYVASVMENTGGKAKSGQLAPRSSHFYVVSMD